MTWQGHPEFSKTYEQALLDIRQKVLDEETFNCAQKSMLEATDELKVAQWMIDFFRQALADQ